MCDSFVGCKYGIHRKFMSVLYWQAGVFHVLLWSRVLLVTQTAPVHLKQAKWLPRRGDSLTHATLLPAFWAMPEWEVCATQFTREQPIRPGWRHKGLFWHQRQKYCKGNQYELFLRWPPSWVATLSFLSTWWKHSVIDIRDLLLI